MCPPSYHHNGFAATHVLGHMMYSLHIYHSAVYICIYIHIYIYPVTVHVNSFCKNEFMCTVTGKTYKVGGKLCCTSSNVIYLISCKLCKEKYVGSAFKDNFKPRFRVHKSDVITGKERCGVAKHFFTKCTNDNKLENIEVQLYLME